MLGPVEFRQNAVPTNRFLGERDVARSDDFPIHVGKDCGHVGFHHPVEERLILELKGPERHISILLKPGLHESDFFVRKRQVEGGLVELGRVKTEANTKSESLHGHRIRT